MLLAPPSPSPVEAKDFRHPNPPAVLHVNKFFGSGIGGIERVVADHLDGPDGRHFRVLACHRKRDAASTVRVVRVPTAGVVLSMPLSLSFYPRFRRMLEEADIVHFHHPFPLAETAALLHGLKGKKVVVSYHSDIVRQRWLLPIYGPVLHAFLRRSDRILVASKALLKHSQPLRDFRKKCLFLPYGVRPDEAIREQEPLPLPNGDFILFVGRLVPYKGVKYLIRAMASVEAPLVLAGDGPERKTLEVLARREGIAHRVHFLGHLSEPRLRYCYSRSQMLVLPSVAENEAFGLVQLEAMSHGKPVVNTHLPTGVPEVSVHEVSGLTVPPRDSVALADAIRTIRGDPDRYARYCAGAGTRAREFSLERFLGGVRAVYRELLD